MNSSCKSLGALSTRKTEEGKFVPLGDLVRMVSGGTPSKNNPNYWIGSIPWVSAKDMKSLFISDSQDRISESAVEAGARMVPEGTVLLLTRGMTLLKDVPICVARTSLTFNQDVKALLAQSSLASDYLPYLLLGNKSRLLGLVDLAGHGTGRLNSDSLRALEVWIPPLPEQRAIASVLGALDDKIDLNRRMCQTLEEMARALFKSWFVDFDPVRAKMEGRDPGLPKEIADLFPSRLVDSERGPIPEGWEPQFLSDYFAMGIGGAWGDDEQIRPGAIQVRCLRGIDCHALAEGQLPEVPLRWVTQKQLNDRHLSRGTLLVEGSGSFCGRSLLWRDEYAALYEEPVIYSNFCKRLNPVATSSEACMAWHHMRRSYELGALTGFRAGTAFPNFDMQGALRGVRVPRAPVAIAEVFEQIATQLSRVDLRVQSATLAALRDTLLPKLISGELRVPASLGSMQEVAS